MGWNILANGDAVENTIQFQTEEIPADDALFIASSILIGAHRTVRNVQVIVAALLRYGLIGVSITDNLIGLMVTSVPEENQTRDQKGKGIRTANSTS